MGDICYHTYIGLCVQLFADNGVVIHQFYRVYIIIIIYTDTIIIACNNYVHMLLLLHTYR